MVGLEGILVELLERLNYLSEESYGGKIVGALG